MLNAIRRAKGNINVETYVFTDDATGPLDREATHRCPSNIICDSLRSLSTSGIFFDRLKENDVRVLRVKSASNGYAADAQLYFVEARPLCP